MAEAGANGHGDRIASSAALWVERRQTIDALDRLKQARADERAAINLIFASSNEITIESMAHLAALAPEKGNQAGGYYRKALAYYEDMARRFRDDPEMSLIAAESSRRIGFIRMILNYRYQEQGLQQADAEGPYRRAILICNEAIARAPRDTRPRRLKAEVLEELGSMLMAIGEIPASDACFRQASGGARRQLVADNPGDRELLAQWKAGVNRLRDQLGSMNRLQALEPVLRDSLQLTPDDPELCNQLAWLLAGYPELSEKDPYRPVRLAERATRLNPSNATFWNTLALAEYRAGRYDEAISASKKSMELHQPDAADWLVQALIRGKRGDHPGAMESYARVQPSTPKGPATDRILVSLRKEAEALLHQGKHPDGQAEHEERSR